jgi:hypothetical protein
MRSVLGAVVAVVIGLAGCGCPEGVSPCGNTCVDLDVDPMNCGRCGYRCDPFAAVPACREGSCVILSCAKGWTDADHVAINGCERYVGAALESTCPP